MPSPSIELRNRLLHGLLGDSDGSRDLFLVRCDERAALLIAGEKTQLLMVTLDGPSGDADPDVDAGFGDRLRALIDAQPLGILLVLVVGGGGKVAAVLAEAARGAPDPGNLGVYHLDPGGQLSHLAGRKLGLLHDAAARLAETAPMDESALRSAIENTRRHQEEAAAFAHHATQRFPLACAILGATCVLVYLIGQAHPAGAFGEPLIAVGATHAASVRAGQWWRLLASVFLHGSSTHLLGNMMSLYFLGTFLERAIGAARIVVIYGAAALGGSLASVAFSEHAVIGASGAIWGLMLAGYGLALRPRGVLPGVIANRIKRALAVPLLLNTGISFLPGIGLFAHFGGGAVGLLLVLSGALFPRPVAGPNTAGAVVDGAPPASPAITRVAVTLSLSLALSLGYAIWITRSELTALGV